MRKLKLALYVSLDGVVENPAWTAPYWNDELSDLQADYLYSSDALVLGRVTYEGFAASWPGMEESTGEFGRKMNSMPKFVASNTLQDADWNASIIEGDLAAAVTKLKEQDGGDLLMVYPVVLGHGKRLFNDVPETALRLVGSTTTGMGVAVLTYEQATEPS